MHNQTLMSILDCCTDGPEQFDAVSNIQSMFVTVFVDGQAINVLHNQVGQTIRCAARIQKVADIGVIQVCKDLTLLLEPP